MRRLVLKRDQFNKIKSYTPQGLTELERDLDFFASFSENSPVQIMLTGGLAISLLNKRIYRRHHDYDFSVFTQNLAPFCDYAQDQGYQLVRKAAYLPLGSHVFEYLVSTTPEQVIERRQKGLRLISTNSNVPASRGIFDLFAQEQLPNGDVRTMKGHIFSHESYFPITNVTYNNGSFNIANLLCLMTFKKSRNPVSMLDREKILAYYDKLFLNSAPAQNPISQ